MSKMSLTEATMLALQGKLNLTEDVEIETNDAQVTVTPDKTIINNAEATVTVEQPEDIVVTDTVTEPEEVLPVEDTENIDTMVDDKPVESEVEDTVEEITESKKLKEDDESDENEDEESEESEVEEEPETTEEVPVEDQLTAIDDAVAKIRDMINTLPEEVKSEIFKCEDCEEVPVESEETTEEEIEEPVDELEECDKFNSKTFNEVFTKYYKKYNKKVEKFELTKLLKNKDTLKVEGRLFNTDNTVKELKLEMKQVQRGTKFARYELKTDKKVESARGKQIMMVSAADKVLNCNYMINKK